MILGFLRHCLLLIACYSKGRRANVTFSQTILLDFTELIFTEISHFQHDPSKRSRLLFLSIDLLVLLITDVTRIPKRKCCKGKTNILASHCVSRLSIKIEKYHVNDVNQDNCNNCG